MSTPVWNGICDMEGRVVHDSPRALKAWLKQTMANQPITIEIRKRFPKASKKQHGYWRAYVVPTIGKHLGYLPSEYDAVHDELMRVLCGLKEDADPRLKIRKSSADFNSADFNEWLIEQAQMWAATKLGIVLKDPDPEWKRKAKREKVPA